MVYITLFNVPIRVKARLYDDAYYLAYSFVMSCSCDPSRPYVNFLKMSPRRLQQLINAIGYMIQT